MVRTWVPLPPMVPSVAPEREGASRFGWFRTFVASKRIWPDLDSLKRNDLLRFMSKRQSPRPWMLLLPRVPTLPGSGYCRRISPAVPSGLRAAIATRAQGPLWGVPVAGLAGMAPKTVPILSPIVTIAGLKQEGSVTPTYLSGKMLPVDAPSFQINSDFGRTQLGLATSYPLTA